MATLSNLNTHYVYTVKLVSECLKIVVYNSNLSKEYNISRDGVINTYSKIRDKIITNSTRNFDILERDDSESSFVYKHSESNTRGFDIIIYINSTETEALGYTQLNNVQGADKDINIKLNLSSNIAGVNSIYFENELSVNSNRDFIGLENNDYTSKSIVLNNLPEIKKTYTTNINNVIKNNSSVIYLSNGFISSLKDNALNFHKFNVLKNRRVDPFRIGFDNFCISKYKNDYALYEWKYDKSSIKYCIYTERISTLHHAQNMAQM